MMRQGHPDRVVQDKPEQQGGASEGGGGERARARANEREKERESQYPCQRAAECT